MAGRMAWPAYCVLVVLLVVGILRASAAGISHNLGEDMSDEEVMVSSPHLSNLFAFRF
jgi:hypothetical protein